MTPIAVGVIVAAAVTPVVIVLVRRWELLDVPNDRSSHAAPTPRGGGLAVALASIVALAVAHSWSDRVVGLVVGSAVLGATGLLDDMHRLPAAPRLAVQLATPLVIGLVVVDRSGWELPILVAVGAVSVAGYVNAFNFMDGIDGISGTQAAIAGAFLAAVARHRGLDSLDAAGWAVCGAALGFLPYNAVRARVFLGDVGSYFLGFWLAGLSLLVVDGGAPPLVVLGPFLLYLLDTSTVLVRRARRGARLARAHREHAYQRLHQAGWSHANVTALCALLSAGCAALMFRVIDASTGVQVGALGACVLLVVGYLALPGVLAQRRRPAGNAAP